MTSGHAVFSFDHARLRRGLEMRSFTNDTDRVWDLCDRFLNLVEFYYCSGQAWKGLLLSLISTLHSFRGRSVFLRSAREAVSVFIWVNEVHRTYRRLLDLRANNSIQNIVLIDDLHALIRTLLLPKYEKEAVITT